MFHHGSVCLMGIIHHNSTSNAPNPSPQLPTPAQKYIPCLRSVHIQAEHGSRKWEENLLRKQRIISSPQSHASCCLGRLLQIKHNFHRLVLKSSSTKLFQTVIFQLIFSSFLQNKFTNRKTLIFMINPLEL